MNHIITAILEQRCA